MAETHHVTLADVARAAGVNPSTVSRVLNGRAPVRPDTRARIEAATRRLRYHPSRSARSLASARTWTVGVLLPDLANLMHTEFLRGAQRTLQARNFSLFICDGQLDPAVQEAELTRFLELRVEGLIVTRSFTLTGLLEPFVEAGIPVEPAELFEPDEGGPRDRRAGSLEAFRRLYALGHRDVAVFVHERADAPVRSREMRSRLESIARARDEHGVRGAVHVVPIADPADCAPRLRALLAGDDAPTALIAGNDWMTAPLLGAVQELGLAIPEDVSVVAYGDSRWAAAYRPPLSVIRYDYQEEGETLASRLLVRLGEAVGAAASARGLVPDEFLERGSTGVPRSRHGARDSG